MNKEELIKELKDCPKCKELIKKKITNCCDYHYKKLKEEFKER